MYRESESLRWCIDFVFSLLLPHWPTKHLSLSLSLSLSRSIIFMCLSVSVSPGSSHVAFLDGIYMKPLLVSARLIDSAVISQTPTLFNSVSTAGPGLPLATGQSAARLKRVTDPSVSIEVINRQHKTLRSILFQPQYSNYSRVTVQPMEPWLPWLKRRRGNSQWNLFIELRNPCLLRRSPAIQVLQFEMNIQPGPVSRAKNSFPHIKKCQANQIK